MRTVTGGCQQQLAGRVVGMHDVVVADGAVQGKHEPRVVHGIHTLRKGMHGDARPLQLVAERRGRAVEEQHSHLVTTVTQSRQQVYQQVLRPASAQGGDEVEDTHFCRCFNHIYNYAPLQGYVMR